MTRAVPNGGETDARPDPTEDETGLLKPTDEARLACLPESDWLLALPKGSEYSCAREEDNGLEDRGQSTTTHKAVSLCAIYVCARV
jgi:hypothetical protein